MNIKLRMLISIIVSILAIVAIVAYAMLVLIGIAWTGNYTGICQFKNLVISCDGDESMTLVGMWITFVYLSGAIFMIALSERRN